MTEESISWNRETVRSLRLRLGWTRCDLARRLQCSFEDVVMWEEGTGDVSTAVVSDLELLRKQADVCCDEMQITPVAESECEKKALEQIHFSRVKENFE